VKNLVLIHGWGATLGCWQRQVEFFQGRVEVLTPKVPAWENGWLMELLGTLPPAGTVAVGWSLGGMLLLEALAAGGINLARVVLMGVPAVFCRRPDYPLGQRPAAVRAMRQGLKQDAGKLFKDFARQCLAPAEESWIEEAATCFVSSKDAGSLAAGLDYLLHQDLRSLLPELAGSTPIIIQGDQDAIVPLEQGLFLGEHLPGASLKIIPGAGHLPFLTRAGMVNDILEEALAELASV